MGPKGRIAGLLFHELAGASGAVGSDFQEINARWKVGKVEEDMVFGSL